MAFVRNFDDSPAVDFADPPVYYPDHGTERVFVKQFLHLKFSAFSLRPPLIMNVW